MFTVDGFNLTITRGDTATLELTFEGDAPAAADSVIAQVKKSPQRLSCEIEKTLLRQEDGTYLMEFASADTAELPFGTYSWDLRILYADGQVTTPFAPAQFRIVEVVTDLPGEGDGA